MDNTARIWNVQLECNLDKFRPIDYLILYLLKHEHDKGNAIDIKGYPTLEKTIKEAQKPMQEIMKPFIGLPIEEIKSENDPIMQDSIEELMQDRFKDDKPFILSINRIGDIKHFYEATGFNRSIFNNKLYGTTLEKTIDPFRNQLAPTEVLYYVIEGEGKNFKFIATLADLLLNNEAGKKLQELLKAAYS